MPNCTWIDTKYEAMKTWHLDRSTSSLEALSTKYTEYDKAGHHNALADTLMLANLYNFMTSKPEFNYIWKVKSTTDNSNEQQVLDKMLEGRCPF